MQCRVEVIIHTDCPDKEICLADPSGLRRGHRETVKRTQCPNEAAVEEYCQACADQLAPVLAAARAQREREEAEAEAAQAAAEALAASEIPEEL